MDYTSEDFYDDYRADEDVYGIGAKGFRAALDKAATGSAQDKYDMGERYYVGRAVEEDGAKALYWFRQAAEMGHVEAMYNVGHIYYCGSGLRFPVMKAAIEPLTAAAERGHVKSMLMLYELYRNRLGVDDWDFEKAAYYLKAAAETGDGEALYTLGKLYFDGFWLHDKKGYTFPTDPEKGRELLERAAKANNLFAANELAERYRTGNGLPKDSAKAMTWLEAACARGNRDGLYRMGECYLCGHNAEQNAEKAVACFSKAYGSARAYKRLGDCYLYGRGVRKNVKKARQYYEYAARDDDFGGSPVRMAVARIFATDGALHDEVRATYWYARAARFSDNIPAMVETARRFFLDPMSGNDFLAKYGVNVNEDDALSYYRRAAEAGDETAKIEYEKHVKGAKTE